MTMRIAHCMIRVSDLDRSLGFYLDRLGMTLLRREDYPVARFTLAFVGFGCEDTDTVIELTHNWDISANAHGTAFGHLALEVDDVAATCARLKDAGVKIPRPAGPMAHVSPDRDRQEIMAFIEDPDGYRIELIERQAAR